MVFRRVYVGAGRKCEGRLKVWETREVREEARHNCPASLHLPSLPRTNLKKALGLARVAHPLRRHRANTLPPDIDGAPGPCANTLFPYNTNAYPSRRSSAAPFSSASHIPSYKGCGDEHHDPGPTSPRLTLMTASRSQEGPM